MAKKTKNITLANEAGEKHLKPYCEAAEIAAEYKRAADELREKASMELQDKLDTDSESREFTGTVLYLCDGKIYKIRVQRPTSYTWEMNTQIQDENLTYYKRLHCMYEQLQTDVKEARADLKHTGDRLANAHPDSESIKHGFTVAIMV